MSSKNGRGVERRPLVYVGQQPCGTAQLLCLAKVVFGTSPPPLLV